MAEPDCAMCDMLGIRSCDVCGEPVADRYVDPSGSDLCDDHRRSAAR